MILARAPLRISLGGGGTDLPSYYREHGGFVLSAAIDKYVYLAVNRPSADDRIHLKYSISEVVDRVDEIQHDLVRPALDLLDIRSNIEIASMADVPAGTGLGSSSAYLVALLLALHEQTRARVTPVELAELAFHIEEQMAGHPVGKQDHYLAALGGIVCLEIERDGSVAVAPFELSRAVREELSARMLLFFTGISRSANEILEQQRTDTAASRGDVVDSLHRTKSVGLEIRDALVKGDVGTFGSLLHEHWENKKRRSQDISAPDVDRWYDVARDAGAAGGKLVGAGGGGFLMLLCGDGSKVDVRAALAAEGLRELVYRIDDEGAKVMGNF
jgi:D-glycero-alpha-D-manno-heptose-7-phosphate kinase